MAVVSILIQPLLKCSINPIACLVILPRFHKLCRASEARHSEETEFSLSNEIYILVFNSENTFLSTCSNLTILHAHTIPHTCTHTHTLFSNDHPRSIRVRTSCEYIGKLRILLTLIFHTNLFYFISVSFLYNLCYLTTRNVRIIIFILSH